MTPTSWVRLWDELDGRIPKGFICGTGHENQNRRASVEEAQQFFASNIDQAERIVADGISDLCHEGISLEEIDSVIPPFPVFWLEWREQDANARQRGIISYGALCSARKDIERGEWNITVMIGMRTAPPHVVGHQIAVTPLFTLNIGTDGRPLSVDIAQRQALTEEFVKELSSQFWSARVIELCTAISLMNCKNVALPWVSPPEKLARSYRRRNGVDLGGFRVINIVPATKLKSTDPPAPRVANPAPACPTRLLHTVRGHIKRYSVKGLFGKYKGTYFFSEHQAGDKTRGEKQLSREYTIKPTGGKV